MESYFYPFLAGPDLAPGAEVAADQGADVGPGAGAEAGLDPGAEAEAQRASQEASPGQRAGHEASPPSPEGHGLRASPNPGLAQSPNLNQNREVRPGHHLPVTMLKTTKIMITWMLTIKMSKGLCHKCCKCD